MNQKNKALAFFNNGVNGTVILSQKKGEMTEIEVDLSGLPPNKLLGFHIHEFGDISQGCKSIGSHYNPRNKNHGSYIYTDEERHEGDLINNLYTGKGGKVKAKFKDPLVSLFPPYSVIGRAIAIHADMDDLGLGGNEGSKKSGNSGEMIACAIIGIKK